MAVRVQRVQRVVVAASPQILKSDPHCFAELHSDGW